MAFHKLRQRYYRFWRGILGYALVHYQTGAPKGESTVVIQDVSRQASPLSDQAIQAESSLFR